jgi:predicted DNA-binding protein
MITLRLDSQLEQTINSVANQLGVSKSELIRKSITDFLGNLEKPSPWELGGDLFGKYASGQHDLSINRKVLIKEKVSAKR